MLKRFQTEVKVVAVENIGDYYYMLSLKHPEKLPVMLPGQFVQVQIPDSANTYLRRPISRHDFDYSAGLMHLLIRKAGHGTKLLSTIAVGESVNILYPLGNGFDIQGMGNRPLLIGGGVGVAPLYALAKEAQSQQKEVYALLGARSSKDLLCLDKFEKTTVKTEVTTEDGSLGTKGMVTNHVYMNDMLSMFTSLVVCGPMPMMRAVASIAEKAGIPCQVSLENKMACGIGACLCCVTEDKDGHNKCVCTEGPVFDSKELKW